MHSNYESSWSKTRYSWIGLKTLTFLFKSPLLNLKNHFPPLYQTGKLENQRGLCLYRTLSYIPSHKFTSVTEYLLFLCRCKTTYKLSRCNLSCLAKKDFDQPCWSWCHGEAPRRLTWKSLHALAITLTRISQWIVTQGAVSHPCVCNIWPHL